MSARQLFPKSNFKQDGKKAKKCSRVWAKLIPMQDEKGINSGEILRLIYLGVHMDLILLGWKSELFLKGKIISQFEMPTEEISINSPPDREVPSSFAFILKNIGL